MKLRDGMLCPVCEAGKLKAVTKDVPFEYKGQELVVGNVRVFECTTCDESLWDEKDEREVERSLTDARRRIDHLLSSDEIRAIRQLYGMTQVEFAKALQIGEKNIARYESGQSNQSRAMDHLLRMLQANPQNLKVIYKDWPGWPSEKHVITVQMFRRRQGTHYSPILNEQGCEVKEDAHLNECAV